ncbi:MAG: 2-isopropylmalate synthase [Candidatus Moranbacteria bacterium]|nr:2-isopropylmalate synthase [Candidatus Moranbacteria bacterium]
MNPQGMNPNGKYVPFKPVQLRNRTWPDNVITKAPIWCEVGLRDGNQALQQPMNVVEKLEMFELSVVRGFKEIEIGFPSASQDDFDFTRKLIEEDRIPEDVTIQVLTQAKKELIKKTFEAIEGAKSAIVHLYNSTSTLQRRVVFKMNRQQIVDLAIQGTRIIREEAKKASGNIRFEYSPESFTGTELDFAVEICEEVMSEWGATKEQPVIINLPATVEMATPNIYADQIEWFIRNMKNREAALISLHAHNDRGSAVAATELALMAGADRVEGTLFGNGERTGNACIVTLAMNMFSQGVDPELDFSNIDRAVNVYERCTKMSVHPRHPYAGKLVYTAFSGSHQDAIKKGMKDMRKSRAQLWEVPYLPIDPEDVGRDYHAIIRVNSQSGKAGPAWVMEEWHGFKLPKEMNAEFGAVVQAVTDKTGKELSYQEILDVFTQEYFLEKGPYSYRDFNVTRTEGKSREVDVCLVNNGKIQNFSGKGNGPIDAFCNAAKEHLGLSFKLMSFEEHSLNGSSSADAVSYISLANDDGKVIWGVGIDSDTTLASIKAVISAFNRMSCAS